MSLQPFRIAIAILLIAAACASAGDNLVPDPSFEEPKEKDRWGHVFAKWSGWIYEGECEFRVSGIARTGKHSLLMVGGNNPKIRACSDKLILEPGRYRIRAYLRGLDIGTGIWNQVFFDDEPWHCIEAYFRLNTLDLENDRPNRDDIVRGWFDGKLLVERTDVVLRSTDFPDMKFSQFLMAPYFGPGLLPHAQKLWVDELALDTQRIGPLPAKKDQAEEEERGQ